MLYGSDQGKTVEAMLAENVVPQNSQAVCGDTECFTWNAVIDRDVESVPIGLGDINRNEATGVSISCAAGQAINAVAVTGVPVCVPIRHCYYRKSGGCKAGYADRNYGICCNF